MPGSQRFYSDDETGEIITYRINAETGEPAVETCLPFIYCSFRAQGDSPNSSLELQFPRGKVTRSKRFQSLKANILAGSNAVSHRVLLIPTLTIFPGFLCILIMLLEVFLHVRCHKKNKHLTDPSLFYRSPFHIVTSTFCAVCRENASASRISQLQDQRRDRYDYFRGIAI